MTINRYLSPENQHQIRKRANDLCEYCHTSKKWQYVKFTIDHVIPLTKGGLNTVDNLALACFHCNRHKSNKITIIDPESGIEFPLFNPRQHNWNQHFIWSNNKLYIVGLTSIGKTAIITLRLNRERVINIRAADLEIGRHPPLSDPVQD